MPSAGALLARAFALAGVHARELARDMAAVDAVCAALSGLLRLYRGAHRDIMAAAAEAAAEAEAAAAAAGAPAPSSAATSELFVDAILSGRLSSPLSLFLDKLT